jgi:hypothetical protein
MHDTFVANTLYELLSINLSSEAKLKRVLFKDMDVTNTDRRV